MPLRTWEESVLDTDGSCRDLNFEAPTWSGVKGLLASLERASEQASGTDMEGHAIGSPLPEAAVAVAQKRSQVQLLFKGGAGLVKSLRVYVCSEENGSPFVELSFLPDDVAPTFALRSDFIAWAQGMQAQLGARRYFARYENASWQFGDTGPKSGVFLVGGGIAPGA